LPRGEFAGTAWQDTIFCPTVRGGEDGRRWSPLGSVEDFADQQVEVVRGGAVVAQGGAQDGAAVDGDGGQVGAPVVLDAAGDAGVEGVRGVPVRVGDPEAGDRPRAAGQQLEPGFGGDPLAQLVGEGKVVLDQAGDAVAAQVVQVAQRARARVPGRVSSIVAWDSQGRASGSPAVR